MKIKKRCYWYNIFMLILIRVFAAFSYIILYYIRDITNSLLDGDESKGNQSGGNLTLGLLPSFPQFRANN